MERNDDDYRFPVVTYTGLKFRKGRLAALKSHGVTDIKKEFGKAIRKE